MPRASDVRDFLLSEHREFVTTTLACADSVAAGWDGESTTDRAQVVPPFETLLERSGVLPAAPSVLAGCVAAAGERLGAQPVAAPPYVVVTGEGLLLRATLDEKRLLVRVRAFTLERDPPRYVRGPEAPEDALEITVR
ncbi:hypothetical protein [Natronomonas sp. EA1]|uniref:hypothetical protein n=1 Tax=Natronomonas sp. EA1 TaxID=3421655 RepID=UPI003EBFD1FA